VFTNGTNGVTGLVTPGAIRIGTDSSGNVTVYVSTGGGSRYVAAFSRNSITRALTQISTTVVSDASVSALSGSFGISISPDGNYVYAQGLYDSSVTSLVRNSTGALTAIQIIHQGDSIPSLSTVSTSLDTHIVYDKRGNVLQRIENYNPASQTTAAQARVTSYSKTLQSEDCSTERASRSMIRLVTILQAISAVTKRRSRP
jgi:hypothetical protein